MDIVFCKKLNSKIQGGASAPPCTCLRATLAMCLSLLKLYRYNNPRKCDISNEILHIYKKCIASSSNNIFYVQIHHFTHKTMLKQTLYYTIQYLEPNTKSKGSGNHLPLVADVVKIAW